MLTIQDVYKRQVMYLGNLVEYGETDDIFANPLHPYTKALFSAIPIPDPTVKREPVSYTHLDVYKRQVQADR